MFAIKLLKNRAGDFSQLLDSAELPDLESADDVSAVVAVLGKMLSPYAASLNDPNLVSVLNDKTVINWTLSDLSSIKYLLKKQGFDLLIFKVAGESVTLTAGNIEFLILNNDIKELGYFSEGWRAIRSEAEVIEKFATIAILKKYFDSRNYFPSDKFNENPVKEMLISMSKSLDVLGTINMLAMNRLNMTLNQMGIMTYAYSLA